MTEPRIDAEDLAALLDGRLDERQRAEVLAQLASSDEAVAAYADAVIIARELETGSNAEPESTASLLPHRRTTQRHHRPWRWVALAAAIAAVAVAPWIWMQVRAPAAADDPGRFAALLGAGANGFPDVWEQRPWSTMRSAGEPLTPQARAVRLGSRLTGLEIAVRAQDTAAAIYAAEIVRLLDDVPAAGPVAAVYREVGARTGETPDQLVPLLKRGRTAVAQLAGEEWVELGAWAEAGRIAAARHDASFFRARASRATLERAGGLPDLGEPARAVLDRIQAATLAEGPRDWTDLQSDLSELLRILGS